MNECMPIEDINISRSQHKCKLCDKRFKLVTPLKFMLWMFMTRKNNINVMSVKLDFFLSGNSRNIRKYIKIKLLGNVTIITMGQIVLFQNMDVNLHIYLLKNANLVMVVRRLSVNLGTDNCLIIKEYFVKTCYKIVLYWFNYGLGICKFSSQ